MVFTILSLCYVNNFCQSTPQISISFEIYDDAGGQKTLYFGLDQTATDGIDIHLGESELPPYPPVGAFDARWLLPENGFSGTLSSWSDYRFVPAFPFTGTIEHRFRYQSRSGATVMYIGWNLPATVTGLIQDLSNGTIINLEISGSGIYEINNFQNIDRLKLFIYYNNVVSSVEDIYELPLIYQLEQNFPNPFNPSTVIEFSLPEDVANVRLSIYSILGEKVAELVNTSLQVGRYQYQWNAQDVATGMYIYELMTDNFVSVKKMLLLR
ncbi:MAG: T9SS type A sorting domain-containing protein [bacterium]|nr:T9SS type A sorting domain-containing protein [bacterium]